MRTGVRERIGAAIGALWAPAVAAISRARESRMFHPEGHTFAGSSELVATSDRYVKLGASLAGRVLARCSAALWKGGFEHFDVLGLALRFRRNPGDPLDEIARPGDTDLLTATIRSPFTMLASPFFTNAHDFAGNKYWAVSPFAPDDLDHRVELRLVPVFPESLPHEGSRVDRLRTAVEASRAAWWLEARQTLHFTWERINRITLERPVAIDQAALKFDPFRGVLNPVGVVHAIRRATYASSQLARPT